jgi:hypothetical protein
MLMDLKFAQEAKPASGAATQLGRKPLTRFAAGLASTASSIADAPRHAGCP